MVTDEELRKKAEKIAKKKSDFFIHLAIYVSVNLFLFVQWLVIAGPNSFPWFVFPLFGWGIGITAHAVETYRGDTYIEKRAEKEYQKLKNKE